jgi:hypothetical protein
MEGREGTDERWSKEDKIESGGRLLERWSSNEMEI